MTEQEKREKVIKGLECCMGEGQCCGMCDNCPYNTDKMRCDLATLHQDALALLKAQEPIKRELNTIIRGEYWFNCGACKCPIETTDKYCSNCGRPVKWE